MWLDKYDKKCLVYKESHVVQICQCFIGFNHMKWPHLTYMEMSYFRAGFMWYR